MTKYYHTALLIGILFLGVCYGQERADAAKRDAELTRLEQEARVLSETTARAVVSLARERQRGDSLARIAQAAVRRRDRAVVSSDSVLARVGSVISAPPSLTSDTSGDTLLPLLADLRLALLSERSAASLAIASLEETVSAQASALAAADSVIVAQGRQVQLLQQSLAVAQQRPPWYRRVVSVATKVAVGVAVGAILSKLP